MTQDSRFEKSMTLGVDLNHVSYVINRSGDFGLYVNGNLIEQSDGPISLTRAMPYLCGFRIDCFYYYRVNSPIRPKMGNYRDEDIDDAHMMPWSRDRRLPGRE